MYTLPKPIKLYPESGTHRFMFRISEANHELVERARAILDMNQSEFIRWAVVGAALAVIGASNERIHTRTEGVVSSSK